MKKSLLLVTALVAVAILVFGIARAADTGLAIPWSSINNGGGTSSGGSYTLGGSIGQADAGTSSGGSYTLQGGFWGGVVAATPTVPTATTLVVTATGTPGTPVVITSTPTGTPTETPTDIVVTATGTPGTPVVITLTPTTQPVLDEHIYVPLLRR